MFTRLLLWELELRSSGSCGLISAFHAGVPAEMASLYRAHSEYASPRTSSDDAHSEGTASPTQQVADLSCHKKRKHTYYTRKYELETLGKESKTLIHQLEQLQERRPCPLAKILSVNAALRSMIKRNCRIIATAQSLMDFRRFACGKQLVGSYIYLPADEGERQRQLQEMKPRKIRDATEYLIHRSQHLDLRLPMRQTETSTTAQDEQVYSHWEICTFDGDKASPQQVFNAMIYFVRHEEIEDTDTTGGAGAGTVKTQQANASSGSSVALQARTISTHDCGVATEKNAVIHAEFSHGCELLSQPHGVLSIDSVDHDDACPYQPETYIRKDIAMAALVLQSPQRRSNEPKSVTLIRWAQMKIHVTPLAPPDALQGLAREGLSCYFDSMVRSIREQTSSQQENTAT